MEFPDFPFKERLPSYVGHKEVLEYIQDYAKHFDLYKFIKFGTKVINVTPKHRNDLVEERFVKWQVTSQSTSDDRVAMEVFDAVIVCNG